MNDQTVDGGTGFDTASLTIGFDRLQISLGSSPTAINIGEMSFTKVERFVFASGETYSFGYLIGIAHQAGQIG